MYSVRCIITIVCDRCLACIVALFDSVVYIDQSIVRRYTCRY